MPKAVGEITVAKEGESSTEKGKRGRKAGAIYFPRHTLKKALIIAETIWKDNQGEPYGRLRLAGSLNLSPTGSPFIMLLASSFRYGLTEGSYVSEKIVLTPLGRSIVAETAGTDPKESLRKALMSPPLFQQIFKRFDQKPFPRPEVFKNTLQIEYKIPKGDVDTCYTVIGGNIQDYGLVQDIKGTKYFQLDLLAPAREEAKEATEEIEGRVESESKEDEGFKPEEEETTIPKVQEQAKPKLIFVAHGKNKKPLEQAIKILEDYGIKHVVAVEEANRARPISLKVADEMNKCTAGIFIFTADEKTTDADGNDVWRPSDNLVYELGAGSILYGNKIVIFREEGVDFASDFKEIGNIPFEKNKLDAKGLDLIKELRSLGIIKFEVA